VKPYRRHLIGLPLQRSVFSNIDQAPQLIGLEGVLSDDRLGARVDDVGDLYLDPNNVDQLATAMSERISPRFLADMERSLVSACHTVGCTTDLCRARAAAATADEARLLIGTLGSSLRTLVPFGILSKFVPDTLFKALASTAETEIPRLRYDSPGAVLTRDAFALYEECGEQGFPPDRLLAEWPAVPPVIAERVREFCEKHSGFGPLPWEAPGYEDPAYVFAALRAIFADGDSAEMSRRLGDGVRRSGNVPRSDGARIRSLFEETELQSDLDSAEMQFPQSTETMLRRAIVVWLEFLERETWYVRRAFYAGLVPLLRRLKSDQGQRNEVIAIDDLLFFELDELSARQVIPDLARIRREKYLGNSEYLIEYGISADRLGRILGES